MREWGDTYITELVVPHLGSTDPRQILDYKSKEIFLLSFLALLNLDAVWYRSGWGMLFKLYVLVMSVKEASSFRWRVLQAWKRLSL